MLAWLLVPCGVGAASWALGRVLARCCGVPLGSLTAPAGFLAGIVLVTLLLQAGATGQAAGIAVTALAGGCALLELWASRRPSRATPWAWTPALAGAVAAYAIGIAPLVGSGHSGVLGYVLNNDPTVHLSIVAWLRGHGTASVPITDSFHAAAALVNAGYPLGSYAWVLVGSVGGGIDPFHIWTPMIAVAAAMSALTLADLVEDLGAGRLLAATAGAVIASGYLPYSYLAQGGAKEVELAFGVFATLALAARGVRATGWSGWRAFVPAILGAVATVDVFGLGAMLWLGPMAALPAVVWAWRHRSGLATHMRRPAMALPALLFLAAAAASLASSVKFLRASERVISNPLEVGNLLGAVPWTEAFNIRISRDYRISPPPHPDLTHAGVYLAAALALVGLLWASGRRRFAPALALLGCAVASVFVDRRYSIYFTAKSYVVLALALGLATTAGVLALRRSGSPLVRIGGTAAGLVAALAVLASDALVYQGVWTTPRVRFQELMIIGRRFAGKGPVLVDEREQYAIYLLRRADPWESWGQFSPDRGFRFGPVPPGEPETPDLDDYRRDFISGFPLLLERRRPGGSAPPSNYRLAFATAHYRVWRRVAPMPAMHVSLGLHQLDGKGAVDCTAPDVLALMRRARLRREPILASTGAPDAIVVPSYGWAHYKPTGLPTPDGFLPRLGGFQYLYMRLPAVRLQPFVQGSYASGIRLVVAGRKSGDAYGDLGLPDSWQPLRPFTGTGEAMQLYLQGLRLPWWRAGSRHGDFSGPLALQPLQPSRLLRVPARRAQSLCGKRLDWLEAA